MRWQRHTGNRQGWPCQAGGHLHPLLHPMAGLGCSFPQRAAGPCQCTRRPSRDPCPPLPADAAETISLLL